LLDSWLSPVAVGASDRRAYQPVTGRYRVWRNAERKSIVAEMTELTEYERARVYFEMGDPARAARLLEPVAAAEPRSVSVRMLLARAYYHSAQLRRAESEFRAVAELDPVEDYALFALGRVLERQSRPDEALPYFRMAAAMRPDPEYLDTMRRAEDRARGLTPHAR
jgi:Tfp pilus assembly protein PilF